jgi:rubrerythrin
MEQSAQIAMKNRTGLGMSPTQSKQLLESLKGIDGQPAAAAGDGHALAEMRATFRAEAEPLGTVPAPTSLKGMAKSGAKMLAGKRPQVLIDKLAERAAFERGGTRLYEGVLVKLRAESRASSGEVPRELTEGMLSRIRDEEAGHFRLVSECIEQLGGDPTVETPSADLAGIESTGLLQAVSDPRTTLAQSLHAALAAELVDHAGWELLIRLSEEIGNSSMVRRFREALRQEDEHLSRVRGWYEQLTLAEGGASAS